MLRHDALGHWIAEAGTDAERLPALSGEIDADVAVLGGGYTGMWSAWWAKALEPSAKVVLLEANRCGLGPSGRNGGFVNSMWFSLPALVDRFGLEAALEVCRAARSSVDVIGEWCRTQEVDAWFVKGGYLQVSAAPAQDRGWDPVATALAGTSESSAVEILDRAAARSRCASPVFRSAAFYPDAATVQPALLAAGLRDRVRVAGVEIFEDSPARLHRTRAGQPSLRSEGGTVRAGTIVLGIGARLAGVRGLKHSLTLTSSHMVVTEPVPDVISDLGWTGGECITDGRAMIHYFRTTRDQRIAFGWGGGRIVRGANVSGRAEVDPNLAPQVEAHLRRFFPQLEGRRVTHAWGGPIDVSPTHLPMIRSLGDRVFSGFGYTGNGVGPSQMLGRSLASLALDRSDPESRLAFIDPPRAAVPPEPLRWIGGAAIRAAILRKERLEEEGRRPDPLTRALTRVPKWIGIHVGR